MSSHAMDCGLCEIVLISLSHSLSISLCLPRCLSVRLSLWVVLSITTFNTHTIHWPTYLQASLACYTGAGALQLEQRLV